MASPDSHSSDPKPQPSNPCGAWRFFPKKTAHRLAFPDPLKHRATTFPRLGTGTAPDHGAGFWVLFFQSRRDWTSQRGMNPWLFSGINHQSQETGLTLETGTGEDKTTGAWRLQASSRLRPSRLPALREIPAGWCCRDTFREA